MIHPRQSNWLRNTGILAFIITLLLTTLITWKHSQRAFFVPTLRTHNDPQWLLGIFVAPDRFVRRNIIRSTWASRYSYLPYDFRFIIGNYSSNPWAPLIDAENSTYGDIWTLDEFGPETAETANKNKNMYFFNYMVQQQSSHGRRYDFVSKVDDDNWFNIPLYYDNFLAPRLPGGLKYDSTALTWIGRPMHWDQEYVYASGRIYTISWPLLELFAGKYNDNPVSNHTEDELMGYYLYEERISHEFVVMELEQAWDIGLESIVDDKNETMVIHGVKHDERLLEISTIFDEGGTWNGKKVSGLTSYNRTMLEVVERIGWASIEDTKALEEEWALRDDGQGDAKDTLDWKLIRDKISIEDREEMGRMYPLSLPGNNASTGVG